MSSTPPSHEPASGIPEELYQKIATLRENDATVMALERGRLDEALQLKRSSRIWGQLTPEEQEQIRSAVGEFQPPSAAGRPAGLPEDHCLDYIREVLADLEAAGGDGSG